VAVVPDGVVLGTEYEPRSTAAPEPQAVSDEMYILNKSKDQTRTYCPGCEPATNPLTELVTMCYCGTHCPADSGADDLHGAIPDQPAIPGDAGGQTNRAFCDFFHRGVLPNVDRL